MEIDEKSFEKMTNSAEIRALLVVTTNLLTDTQSYLSRKEFGTPEARRLLERCQSVITLLSHDLWLLMDDGE